MNALLVIEAVEAALNLAVAAGINFSKLAQMREANGGEPLTEEQRQQLSDEAQDAIDQL